jgi:Na+/proline symporter
LVLAAVFSAAMGTLSGSLNSSSSATVNDLYRPFAPQATERHLLYVSKSLTLVWGVAQMGVALASSRLRDDVVTNVLTIASFVTGIVLGLFLLGTLTRRVDERSALLGLVAGVIVVSLVAFCTAVAGLWYALIGSSTVVAVGLFASLVLPAPSSQPAKSKGIEP